MASLSSRQLPECYVSMCSQSRARLQLWDVALMQALLLGLCAHSLILLTVTLCVSCSYGPAITTGILCLPGTVGLPASAWQGRPPTWGCSVPELVDAHTHLTICLTSVSGKRSPASENDPQPPPVPSLLPLLVARGQSLM